MAIKINTPSLCKKLSIAALAVVMVLLVVFLVKYYAFPSKSESTSNRGAIVTNGHACAEIGTSILEKGGSAADAAIAALFCEGVSMPQSMGLGGGFLLTIYNSTTETVESLNSREIAPIGANETMFNGNSELAQRGGLSVAVPGELRGYWYVYQKYGKLPWRDLVQPTIELCTNGVYVTNFLAGIYKKNKELLYNDPVLRDIFIDPSTNTTYKEGQYIKRARLAKTLEIIAEEGGNALHNGSLTESLVKDIQNNNGIITVEDLNSYTPVWQTPIQVKLFNNDTLYTAPLPGSGAILSFILNILSNFIDTARPESLETNQRIIESFKFGYGKRTELGDIQTAEIQDLIANLTSKSYAEEIRKLIFDNRTFADPLYYGANTTFVEDHGTAHISVLTETGDAVSVTSTINLLFGAGFASNSTGIILNDEMDDFSSPNLVSQFAIPPSSANYIQPGKRPLSSMVPSIVLDKDKKVVLVTGAAGGTKITTSTALVILRHLGFNMDIKDAMDEKRMHHQLLPMTIEFENDYKGTDIVEGLAAIGHNYTFVTADGFSAVTSIANKAGVIDAAYDKRRPGSISYIF